MGYDLHIPACLDTPPHPLHPPSYEKPLRIDVSGPLSAIEKLLPNLSWNINIRDQRELQPAATELARLFHQAIYARTPQSECDLVVRYEVLGWKNPNMPPNGVIYHGPNEDIDFYGFTFDHRVPPSEEDPDTLQILLLETEYDQATFAKHAYRGTIDPEDYAPYRKRLLAIHRCCSTISGSWDRRRINGGVQTREKEKREKIGIFTPAPDSWRLVKLKMPQWWVPPRRTEDWDLRTG